MTQLLDNLPSDCIDLNLDSPQDSIALNQAILNIQYRQQYQWQSLALVPYGECFKYLPAFLVQLICESLGKGVDQNGAPVSTVSCPNIVQGLGPEAQHGFFQQLHQSNIITPVEFISAQPATKNQLHMLQQICGQMVAFAQGKSDENGHFHFSGNRPSTLLMLTNNSQSFGHWLQRMKIE